MREKIRRLIIEDIRPQMDGGTFPIRRAMGEAVQVKAAILLTDMICWPLNFFAE